MKPYLVFTPALGVVEAFETVEEAREYADGYRQYSNLLFCRIQPDVWERVAWSYQLKELF